MVRVFERLGRTPAAATACNYLHEFVCRFSPTDGLAGLSGCQADVAHAVATWRAMCDAYRWHGRHRQRVARALARALGVVVPALADVLLVGVAQGGGVHFESDRSFHHRFSLHECLPLRVRRLTPHHVHYRVLHELLDGMANHLQSVSKHHLQAIGTLLDGLIFADAVGVGGDDDDTTTKDDVLRRLRGVKAREWILRYHRMMKGRGGASRRMSFLHFQRQMKYVSTLHHRVLGNSPAIPIARGAGRVVHPGDGDGDTVLPELAFRGNSSASSSSSSEVVEDGHGPKPKDDHHRVETFQLRTLLTAVRNDLCAPSDPVRDLNRVWAFSRDEVLRILQAAVTTEERLIVCLFLTLGLRIGGLSRLQWCPGAEGTPPREMVTIEKNRKPRSVVLSPGVGSRAPQKKNKRGRLRARILIARHLRASSVSSTPYLFPSSQQQPQKPVSTHYIWSRCRAVFERCGLRGDHVHPHTFRHTAVHMQFMRGRTFEQIAKWIGHGSPTVTSGVYGRLSFQETERMMMATGGGDDDERRAWQRLYETCQLPAALYGFEDWELAPYRRTAAGPPPSRSDRKRAALAYRAPTPASGATEVRELRALVAELVHQHQHQHHPSS